MNHEGKITKRYGSMSGGYGQRFKAAACRSLLIFEVAKCVASVAGASGDVATEVVVSIKTRFANLALVRLVFRMPCAVMAIQIGSFWSAISTAGFLAAIELRRHRVMLARDMATMI